MPEIDVDGQRIRDAIVKYGPITDRWVLRLGKETGEFDPWHTVEADFQEDLEGFLDALSLTRSVHLTTERMRAQKQVVKEAKKKAKAEAKEAEKVAKKEARDAATAERRRVKELEKQAKKDAKAAERLALRESKTNGKATIVDASDPYTPRWCVSCGCQDTEYMQENCLDCPCGCACKEYTTTKIEPAPIESANRPEVITVPVMVSQLPVEQVITRPTIVLPVEV
jgi:hypothetical protein